MFYFLIGFYSRLVEIRSRPYKFICMLCRYRSATVIWWKYNAQYIPSLNQSILPQISMFNGGVFLNSPFNLSMSLQLFATRCFHGDLDRSCSRSSCKLSDGACLYCSLCRDWEKEQSTCHCLSFHTQYKGNYIRDTRRYIWHWFDRVE